MQARPWGQHVDLQHIRGYANYSLIGTHKSYHTAFVLSTEQKKSDKKHRGAGHAARPPVRHIAKDQGEAKVEERAFCPPVRRQSFSRQPSDKFPSRAMALSAASWGLRPADS
mgnify:CR=1 FL=1